MNLKLGLVIVLLLSAVVFTANALAVLALSLLLPPAPVSGQAPKIVFSSNRSGTWQIYSMDMDGGNVTRLTYLPADNVTPTLSRDGRIIAFTAYRHAVKPLGSRDIYLMNADGTHVRRLTVPPMRGVSPGVSPDGRRVAFSGWARSEGTPEATIHVVDVNGTNLINTGRVGSAPSFGPDERQILFTCKDARHFPHICLMNADGSSLVTLADLLIEQSSPRFSADGRKIVFEDCHSEDGCYPYALIYVMNADGSNVHRIEDTSSRGSGASMLPDGRILFTKLRKILTPNYWDDEQICVMDMDGTHEHCLTNGPGRNLYSPFGIAF